MKHILGIYIEGKLSRKVHLEDYPGFFSGTPITLGRLKTCDICIPKSTVSREHAVIDYNGGRVRITDSGSTNKLRVDGKVCGQIYLKNGMKVVIGSGIDDPESVVLMYVEAGDPPASREPAGEKVIEKIKEQIKPAEAVKAEKPTGTATARRIIAFMADCAIVLFMCVGFCGILALPFGFGGIIKLIMVLGVIAIAWVYFALSESDKGTTFGKSLMGLKVVKYDGEVISFRRATCRLAAKALSLFTLFLPVFGKGRCLHDLIAGTVVVRTEDK